MCRSCAVRFLGKLCEKSAGILTYFKDFECNLTKDASKFGAQSEGRDLISGSLKQTILELLIILFDGNPES